MTEEAGMEQAKFVEEPCEYRAEYPGNVGPLHCWRCPPCQRLGEWLDKQAKGTADD